jgi:hypothetical protein
VGKKKTDAELFDISDVTCDIPKSKSRREVILVLRSQSNFNLMKFYLALRQYLEQMEDDIGVLEADGELH